MSAPETRVGGRAVRWGPDGLVPAIVVDAADGAVLMLAWMDAEAFEATLATGDVHFHSRSRGRLWRKGETSGNVLRLRSLVLDCDGDAILVAADPRGPTCHRGTRSCFDTEPATQPGPVVTGELGPDQAGAPAADLAADRPGDRAADRPAGAPAGSTGSDVAGTDVQGFAWLEELWTTIASRAADRPDGSYTTRLLDGGVDAVARKVTEEATEVLLAAKDDAVAMTVEGGTAPGPAPERAAPRAATRAALAGETADLLYHTLVLLAERGLSPAEVVAVLKERHRS